MPVLLALPDGRHRSPPALIGSGEHSGPVALPQAPARKSAASLSTNSTSPVTFWAGNNHHAAILKIEPLD
jgi:hypothetical protein